jgi:hypothetical protein
VVEAKQSQRYFINNPKSNLSLDDLDLFFYLNFLFFILLKFHDEVITVMKERESQEYISKSLSFSFDF